MSEKDIYYNYLTEKSCELSQLQGGDTSDIADARLPPVIIDTGLDRRIGFEKARADAPQNRKVLCGVIFKNRAPGGGFRYRREA
ncbi:TPA: hypothetical protein QDC22_003452 [Burkholderia stabilis]|nr:hypothetical protein [Burkholderia stabilis]HDR9649596.1 hypothetical protein [Burkholderia stabilis]HDR9655337.1 hypothetical protein [Burkholderia stabilis]HDR9679662.1 hypothetical protein [Burkholderia stabilis]